MDELFYMCDLSLYSSSMVEDSLVATDKAGVIHLITPAMSMIRSDHLKKDVKFYPTDDFCFTTTDMIKGLRVWDRVREENVYCYKEDDIRMHAYSNNGCIAAVGDGCVKLYDLRTRYNIGVMALRACRLAEWGDRSLFCVGEDCIVEYDIRNVGVMSERSVSEKKMAVDGVVDFISICAGEFCTVVRESKTCILRMSLSDAGSEVYRRSIGGKMIKVVDGDKDFVIGIPDGNRVGFYEYKDTWMCVFEEFKTVDWIWCGKNNSYVFADRKLYGMEGGYDRLKKLFGSGGYKN